MRNITFSNYKKLPVSLSSLHLKNIHNLTMAGACAKLLLIIISLFIPPLAVWIARNKVCSGTVCLNIILTILGGVSECLYN